MDSTQSPDDTKADTEPGTFQNRMPDYQKSPDTNPHDIHCHDTPQHTMPSPDKKTDFKHKEH